MNDRLGRCTPIVAKRRQERCYTARSDATEHAGGDDAIEKRTARDGRDYIYEEFVMHYGYWRTQSEWKNAVSVAEPIAPGTAAASANNLDTHAPTQLIRTQLLGQSNVTEHANATVHAT